MTKGAKEDKALACGMGYILVAIYVLRAEIDETNSLAFSSVGSLCLQIWLSGFVVFDLGVNGPPPIGPP